ncbi:hypothetical protein NDN08_002766 [Rhodosorus marinus]|uniref:UDP-N-acetylglucosamine transferase subunit ALG14 n=1 Tax=Rhodosorus marinus TaxID=101924 RepID=A0AAV8UUP8_9RHOD|nr:hypothetical protein NDN08_002766 [Rhodosorus marinus]
MLKHISASPVRLERVVYVVAKTDSHSASKAANNHEELLQNVPHKFYFVPRAREVGQSYWTAAISTVYALVYSLSIVPRESPGVLLVNGPGTCVPLAISAFLFNVMLVTKCRIIFVESVARVKSLSLSGKVVYPFADRFLVQWPLLSDRYRLCEYHGRLI